jgi:hypothetical protein
VSLESQREIVIKRKTFEEIMAEKFPKLVKNLNLQIRETQPNLKWINSKKSACRFTTMKML